MSFIIKCDRCKITKTENSFGGMRNQNITFRVEIEQFGYIHHICSLCDEKEMQDNITKMMDKAKQSINNNQK